MLDSLTVSLLGHSALAAGDERLLASIFTSRCAGGTGEGLDRFLPPGRTSFFGYGRQALAEGLLRLGINRGDEVLLPRFVCREILASLAATGATPCFYDVNEALQVELPSMTAAASARTRAVLAVNYFGFPQPLKPLKDWCLTHRVALVEDNAHGFLSEDGSVPLGLRGDIGVFSLRKTLSVPNGGVLVDNRAGARNVASVGPSYAASPLLAEHRYWLKLAVKRFMEAGGLQSARRIIGGVRRARRLLQPPPASGIHEDRSRMPQEAIAPLTLRLLRQLDVIAESERRRATYVLCRRLLDGEVGVEPIFGDLAPGVVPQGFPFRFSGVSAERFIAEWWRVGLQMIRWPEPPTSLGPDVTRRYGTVVLAQFSW